MMMFSSGASTPINSIVEGKLYLGDRNGASSLGLLKSLGVTHVVNAAEEQPNFFPGDLTYYNCNLKDDLTERVDFDGPTWFMQQAHARGGVVFVHCAAGISRSASIVIAYLMKNNGMSMRDAIRYVEQRRPVVDPNDNYRQQLQQLDLGGQRGSWSGGQSFASGFGYNMAFTRSALMTA